jgi:hypothetical protein
MSVYTGEGSGVRGERREKEKNYKSYLVIDP